MTTKWPARIGIALGLAGLFVVLLFLLEPPPRFQTASVEQREVVLSEFLADLDRGMIKDVTIQGHFIRGHRNNGSAFSTYAVGESDLVTRLRDKNVIIRAVPSDDDVPSAFAVFISWIPLAVLVAGFWYLIARLRAVSAALGRIEKRLGGHVSDVDADDRG